MIIQKALRTYKPPPRTMFCFAMLELVHNIRGRSDGGGHIVYPPKKSVQANFLWSNDNNRTVMTYFRISIKVLYLPQNFYTSPKQIPGYAPAQHGNQVHHTIVLTPIE